MTIQITPELASVWRLKTTIAKTAKPSSNSNQLLIEPFEINQQFSSQYLAVGIIVKAAKDSWQFGGRIAQDFKFPNYGVGYFQKGKAFNFSQELLINRVTFVQFPPITSARYKIHYFPPKYFAEVKVQIWEYQGETLDESLEKLVNTLETSTILRVDFSELQPTLDCVKQDLIAIKDYLAIELPTQPSIEPPIIPPTPAPKLNVIGTDEEFYTLINGILWLLN